MAVLLTPGVGVAELTDSGVEVGEGPLVESRVAVALAEGGEDVGVSVGNNIAVGVLVGKRIGVGVSGGGGGGVTSRTDFTFPPTSGV